MIGSRVDNVIRHVPRRWRLGLQLRREPATARGVCMVGDGAWDARVALGQLLVAGYQWDGAVSHFPVCRTWISSLPDRVPYVLAFLRVRPTYIAVSSAPAGRCDYHRRAPCRCVGDVDRPGMTAHQGSLFASAVAVTYRYLMSRFARLP